MNYGMDYLGGGGGDSRPSSSGTMGGGGGFGASQGSGGRGGGGNRRSYDSQTLQPVTVRMILTAQPDDGEDGGAGGGGLQLEDGRKLHYVRIVAATRSVNDYSTNMVYDVEDGTGLIEVKQWLDHNESSAVAEMRERTKQENTYLKIVGQIKDYDGKKMIVADSIRPIGTGNELTHHLLEVIYAAEKYKKGEPSAPHPHAVSSSGVGFGARTPLAAPLSGGAALGGSGGYGSEIDDAVHHYIKVEGSSYAAGISMEKIIQALGGRFNEQAIRRSINDLSCEGHIFSTTGDDYYKST